MIFYVGTWLVLKLENIQVDISRRISSQEPFNDKTMDMWHMCMCDLYTLLKRNLTNYIATSNIDN